MHILKHCLLWLLRSQEFVLEMGPHGKGCSWPYKALASLASSQCGILYHHLSDALSQSREFEGIGWISSLVEM